MARKKIVILIQLLILNVHSKFSNTRTDEILNRCPTESKVNLTGGILDESTGFIVKSGYVFPPESTWIQNDEIFGCVCYNRTSCSPLYCPIGSSVYHQMYENCDTPLNTSEPLPNVPILYSIDFPIESIALNDENVYAEFSYGNCMWMGKYVAISESLEDGIYTRSNGSVYLPGKNISTMYNFDSYCLCDNESFYTYYPACLYSGIIYTGIEHYDSDGTKTEGTTMVARIGMMISIPFLLITFIVYTILPELNNIHGLNLRGYVGCLLVAYTTLTVIQTTGPISDASCLIFAFTIYFSFLASFLWLNAMCFDIWWTFGGFQSVRGNVNQHDRKKMTMYSIYAFGCAILLTGICMIMNFVSEIPDDMIRPEFGVDSLCWFKTSEAKALYFYGPMGVTIIFNIFFFVSTAVKIIRHKKDTAHQLKGTNSKRHDDNKQWFNLYLKLFIVMGINWSMEIASWLLKDLNHVWHVTDLGNALQGVIIFVIFICKKNIKRLLLKRLRCQSINSLLRDSARSGIQSSTLQTGINSISE